MSRTKTVSVLLVSIMAILMTTAQIDPATAQVSPTAAKNSSATKPVAFTLSQGTDTLRALLVTAPPVYAPGGPVCFVEEWTGAEALLAEAEQTAAEHGAVVVRVICTHHETDRAKLLTQRGYSVASEWNTARLPLAGMPSREGIRPLTAADMPRVLELGEQKRRQYEVYSPVFWRMSPLPRKTFGPYMQSQIENPHVVALAHEHNGTVDGFVLANERGYIDDFMVATPELWPTVGANLLLAASAAAHHQGVSSLLVACGQGDGPMHAMLAAQGLTLATDWYVKPILPKKQ